jgi:hypothetical protein
VQETLAKTKMPHLIILVRPPKKKQHVQEITPKEKTKKK